MISKFTLVLIALGASVMCQDELLPGEALTGFEFSSGTLDLLSIPLDLSFTCGDKYGYYADMNNNCQVFHICLPRLAEDEVTVIQVDQWSFICGNGTVFDQSILACNHVDDAIPCESSASFFDQVEYGVIEKK